MQEAKWFDVIPLSGQDTTLGLGHPEFSIRSFLRGGGTELCSVERWLELVSGVDQNHVKTNRRIFLLPTSKIETGRWVWTPTRITSSKMPIALNSGNGICIRPMIYV
jgi:hypothetical protein